MFVFGEWAGRPTWTGCYNIAFDLGVGGLISGIESPIGWGPWENCWTTAGHSQIQPLLLAGEEGCTATATDTASLVELDGNDGAEAGELSLASGCRCTSTLLTLALDFEDDV